MRKFQVHFFFIVLFCCFYAHFARAQTAGSGIPLSADQMERDATKGTVTLTGNVTAIFKGQILNSDKATIYIKEKRIIAEGNVILSSPTLHAEGSRIDFNYDKNTGVIHDGFIKSGQVVFEGKLVERIGEDEYIASDANYTACETCPAAWSFTGRRIHAKLGGYARISRPVLRVAGFPVIFLPWLIVPLKTTRQTGLLTPSLNFSSRGGYALSQDFFWAISQSQDMTLYFSNFEKLGLKSGLEYRYVLSPESRGILRTGHVRDKKIRDDGFVNKDLDRWFVNYRHQYKLPEKYTHRLSVDAASDLRYPRDFYIDLPFNGDPALENKTSLTKNTKNQHFSIESTFFTNLLKSDPLAGNEDAIHRFPEIKYSLRESPILNSNFLFKMDATYVNFGRFGSSYDNISTRTNATQPCDPISINYTPEKCVSDFNDGQFNVDQTAGGTRDLIRTGQRLDLAPSLSYSLLLGNLINVVPTLTYRETMYSFDMKTEPTYVLSPGQLPENYSQFAAQRYLQTDFYAKTRFGRVYKLPKHHEELYATAFKHEIEPKVGYTRIPWMRRPHHGFFGEFENQPFTLNNEPISTTDLFGRNRLQFDYYDRVYDRDLVQFQFSNILTRKRFINGRFDYLKVAMLRLSQFYDVNEAERAHAQAWSPINGLLEVKLDRVETYTEAAYNTYARITNISSRVRVYSQARDFLELTYQRSALVDESNRVVPNSRTENYQPGVGFVTKYFDLTGRMLYSNVTSKIQQWGAEALFKPPGNCWGIQLTGMQTVGGPLDYRFNAVFNYGGK